MNLNNEVSYLHTRSATEMGAKVNELLLAQHGVNIDDFQVGMGDVDEITYNGESTEINYEVMVEGGKLSGIHVQCGDIPELMDGVSLTIDEDAVALYDNVNKSYELMTSLEPVVSVK